MNNDGIVEASGNVFADLDVPQAEEELAKARLLGALRSMIARRKLTQKTAAAIMGVSQPDVSNLVRGRAAGFSLERLLHLLRLLGKDVEIKLNDSHGRQGKICVVDAA